MAKDGKKLENMGVIVYTDRDTNYVNKVMGADFEVPIAGEYSPGFWDYLDEFMGTHLSNSKDPTSALLANGATPPDYKVKVDDTDLEGYLGDKINALDGIELEISGTTNKVIGIKLSLKETASSTGAQSILSDLQTLKRIKALDDTIEVTSDDDYVYIRAIGALPIINSGDEGKKIVVKEDLTGYELVASTTTSGFVDREAQYLSFDNASLTLTITAVGTEYKYINTKGSEFSKATDSIVISDVSGLHGIYYNNSTGTIEAIPPVADKIDIINKMEIDIPITYIQWNSTTQKAKFTTNVLKGRGMGGATWAKNAYDRALYVLQGCVYNNDPSNGGTTNPNASLDSSAQFGIDTGWVLWTDGKYNTPVRTVGADWEVYYINGNEIDSLVKTSFSVLNDTDLAVGTSGAVLYNNNGSPTRVSDNDFVWYFVAVSNDIDNQRRLISFMGQNQYTSANAARNNLSNERAAVEASFGIRQEFTSIYAVLFQTNDNWINGVKAKIRDFFVISPSGEPLPVGGESSPFTPGNTKFVATSGAEYDNFQLAIDSISDASDSKEYTVTAFSGDYNLTNPINMKDYISLRGLGGFETVQLIADGQTVDFNNISGFGNLEGLNFISKPTTDNTINVRIISLGGKERTVRACKFTTEINADVGSRCLSIESTSQVNIDSSVFEYSRFGNSASARTHTVLDLNVTGSTLLNDCKFNLYLEDENDTFTFVKNSSGGSIGFSSCVFNLTIPNITRGTSSVINFFEFIQSGAISVNGSITINIIDQSTGNHLVTGFNITATTGAFNINNVIFNNVVNNNSTLAAFDTSGGATVGIYDVIDDSPFPIFDRADGSNVRGFYVFGDTMYINNNLNMLNKNIENINIINPDGEATSFGGGSSFGGTINAVSTNTLDGDIFEGLVIDSNNQGINSGARMTLKNGVVSGVIEIDNSINDGSDLVFYTTNSLIEREAFRLKSDLSVAFAGIIDTQGNNINLGGGDIDEVDTLTTTGDITQKGITLDNTYLGLGGGTLTGELSVGFNKIKKDNATDSPSIEFGSARAYINSGTDGTNNTYLIVDASGVTSDGGDFIMRPQSSDPTVANGKIYYNVTTHKFRGCEDGVWKDLI